MSSTQVALFVASVTIATLVNYLFIYKKSKMLAGLILVFIGIYMSMGGTFTDKGEAITGIMSNVTMGIGLITCFWAWRE